MAAVEGEEGMQERSNTARMIEELHRRRRGKVVSAAEAVQLVRSGDTVATGGFVGIGFAEGIAVALEARDGAKLGKLLHDHMMAKLAAILEARRSGTAG